MARLVNTIKLRIVELVTVRGCFRKFGSGLPQQCWRFNFDEREGEEGIYSIRVEGGGLKVT